MGRPIPKQDHKVAKRDAAQYTKRHRGQAVPPRPMLAVAFHRDAFERILRQPDCQAIRLYPGLTDAGDPTLVLVGVDAAGNDMVDGELAQFAVTCPPFCSDPNALTDDV